MHQLSYAPEGQRKKHMKPPQGPLAPGGWHRALALRSLPEKATRPGRAALHSPATDSDGACFREHVTVSQSGQPAPASLAPCELLR